MTTTLQPSTIFAGDFRVLGLLGQGGMGSVYVVEQLSTGKQRALKLMLPQLVADAGLRKRFEQEAHVGALIESEHVVEVVGAGVDSETHVPWLAMELLIGEDLSQLVARRGALGPAEVLALFEQLCHALAAAHRVGVVHRDLKPENIFVAQSKRAGAAFTVKVLDFGIAKIVAEAKTSRTAAVGSPMWMAPEQTDGSKVTPASDVWALGLIAFHLLTGRYFWAAANVDEATVTQLLREILLEPIPEASERANEFSSDHPLPTGFDEWFARCVHRDPATRFQNADEALPMLRLVLSSRDRGAVPVPLSIAGPPAARPSFGKSEAVSETMAPSANTAPRAVAGQRRRRAWVLGLGLLALVPVVALALVAGRRHRAVRASVSHGEGIDSDPTEPATSLAAPTMAEPEILNAASVRPAAEPAVVSTKTGPAPLPSEVKGHSPAPAAHAAIEDAGAPAKATTPCLPDDLVQKIVRPHLLRLDRSCFELLEPSKSTVNVTVSLSVGADGFPEGVTGTGDDPSVAQCVEGHVRTWRFPVSGCSRRVSIPFHFPLRRGSSLEEP
jgi:serine/threonine protein kinase